MKENPRQPWILDSTLRIPDSRNCNPGDEVEGTGFQSLSVKLGLWVPITRGIPDSKAYDSGFYMQIFPEFQISRANISQIPLYGAIPIWRT